MPEPSTFSVTELRFRKYGILVHVPFWLTRGGPSTFLVGLAFFRMVTGWRWGEAILGSLALVPFAIGLSMSWYALGVPLWLAHNPG